MKTAQEALDSLKEMTLTVIDGDFPRAVVAGDNLAFSAYEMPARSHSARTDRG